MASLLADGDGESQISHQVLLQGSLGSEMQVLNNPIPEGVMPRVLHALAFGKVPQKHWQQLAALRITGRRQVSDFLLFLSCGISWTG